MLWFHSGSICVGSFPSSYHRDDQHRFFGKRALPASFVLIASSCFSLDTPSPAMFYLTDWLISFDVKSIACPPRLSCSWTLLCELTVWHSEWCADWNIFEWFGCLVCISHIISFGWLWFYYTIVICLLHFCRSLYLSSLQSCPSIEFLPWSTRF